jgi:uncharacterized damage-inducible protein DinB
MPTMARHIPYTATEKESLQIGLDRHREAVLWKLEGLTDEQLRQPILPSGNSLLGLVKHLANWEYIWICRTFGETTPHLPVDDEDWDAEMRVEPHETTADVLAFYAGARAAADAVIERVDMDEIGTTMFGHEVTLRWVLVHELEEAARHSGHVDVMRELIDGVIGNHQPD